MNIAKLKALPSVGQQQGAQMRGTAAQDTAVSQPALPFWRRYQRPLMAAIAGLVLIAVVAWLLQGWANAGHTVPAERLRIAEVGRGHFIRDVAAQGIVIAAVNPTLFAIAPGTVTYTVRAGDEIKKSEVIATLDSPELTNEYERERATLDGMNAALSRQEIEMRRQILRSKQEADLAGVAIEAAERELKRAQWAWNERVIPERDYKRAVDDLATSKLNYEHARDTAGLERDSLALDLRTRRLERDRQALVVESLKRRVDELNVRSPVDGMVANLAQAQKAKVAESAPLLTVVDLGAFEIEFQVAEIYAREIKSGMAAEITLDGRKHAGTVTAISPEVRQNSVVGRVKFANEQPPGLRQNQRAAVRIVLDERDSVLKFQRGSLIDEGTRHVYRVTEDRAVRVPVELGAASVTEVEVTRGLDAGDKVIISDTRDFEDAPELMIVD
jgi:HlyD family secretion protein